MKKLLLFMPLLALCIAFVSCEKNDPKPGTTLKDSSDTSFTLKAVKGENTSTKDLSMSDFKRLTADKFVPEKAIVDKTSQIVLSGLKNNLELSNVTIQVKGNNNLKRTLGTIKKDQTFNSKDDLIFLQKVVEEMMKTKTTKLDLAFTSSEKLDSEIKVILKLNVQFTKKLEKKK